MPLFGFLWGSRQANDDDDDDDAEYESYTDEEYDEGDDDDDDNDDDHIDDDEDGNALDNDNSDAIDRNELILGDSDVNNLSQETNDSNEDMLEPKEFTALLQQLPPDSPEKNHHDLATTSSTYVSNNENQNDDDDDLTKLRRNLPPDHLENVTSTSVPITKDSGKNTIDSQGEGGEDVDPEATLPYQNLLELQNLLFLAIEADRVDIVQELLLSQPQSSNSSSSFHVREYLLNPIIRVVPQPPAVSTATTNESNEASTVSFSFLDHTDTDLDESTTTNYTCTTIPPLHIAMYYGSINALNYLLRTGANPALRPNISNMNDFSQQQQLQLLTQPQQPEIQFVLDVPHIQHYDQCTAWEVAFGRSSIKDDNGTSNSRSDKNVQSTNSWSLFNSNSSSTGSNHRSSNLTASKLESIRHAFFTEAIRCISNDDVQRFEQLHKSGMPIDDDENKEKKSSSASSFTFTKWCHDFNAHQCLKYIVRTQQPHSNVLTTTIQSPSDTPLHSEMNGHNETNSNVIDGRKIPIVSEGLVSLQNRYEELDALCRSLSACLDNVAEEVSVGAGLLLSSNSNSSGAQALASHVRTVKHQREQLLDEYERYQDTYQNTLDELLYYIQQFNIKCNTSNGKYSNEISEHEIDDWWQKNIKNMKPDPKLVISAQHKKDGPTSIPSETADTININDDDDQQREKEQNMITQIMILETKIRRIRATISDLSDDNQRNQKEIERRQLMVGLQYIRTLRNEIRDVEYQIYELKQYDIDCRTKIRTIQNYLSSLTSSSQQQQQHSERQKQHSVNNVQATLLTSDSSNENLKSPEVVAPNGTVENVLVIDKSGMDDKKPNNRTVTASNPKNSVSGKIDDDYDITRRDYTTTMVVHGPTRGFLSLNLWQMLLRIIGMGSTSSSNVSTHLHSPTPRSTASSGNQNGGSSNSATSSRPVIII